MSAPSALSTPAGTFSGANAIGTSNGVAVPRRLRIDTAGASALTSCSS